MQEKPLATVYFDNSCALCRAEIKHYQGQVGADNICFVDVSDKSVDVGSDLERTGAMKRFHVRRPDGSLVSGAAGFVEVWSILPKWRWAARIAKLPPILSMLEIGYRGFLPVRPYLSALVRRFSKSADKSFPAKRQE